ncbi:MAG: hypothetical protein MZV64_60610, partial [Ignavibacteriales bacterium]|nr:hypothetical protein [Ignavibacteriales bacterium]
VFVQLRIAKVNLVTGTQDSSTYWYLLHPGRLHPLADHRASARRLHRHQLGAGLLHHRRGLISCTPRSFGRFFKKYLPYTVEAAQHPNGSDD